MNLSMRMPKFHMNNMILKKFWLDTPLGQMLAISDDKALYLLEFANRKSLEQQIKRLQAAITSSITDPIESIKAELKSYFEGTLKKFKTPIHLSGSAFQNTVWQELINIPYGQTRSYLQQATAIDRKKAVRAVANANAVNKLAIIIPCHRIINNNGKLGGYGGGLTRKKWLIEHEKKCIR